MCIFFGKEKVIVKIIYSYFNNKMHTKLLEENVLLILYPSLSPLRFVKITRETLAMKTTKTNTLRQRWIVRGPVKFTPTNTRSQRIKGMLMSYLDAQLFVFWGFSSALIWTNWFWFQIYMPKVIKILIFNS